jgi:hypothetical protein
MRIEDVQDAILYFNRTDMNSVLDGQRKEADRAVEAINADVLLSTPTEDHVATIAERYALDIPVLQRDQAHLEEPREITMAIQDYGRTIHRSGTLLTLVVSFTGDAGMFWVRPNTFDSAPPRGNLNGNTMLLRVRGTDLNQEAVSKAFNSTLDDFARYLAWQRASADQFNPEIARRVRSEIEARKARLLADRNLVANLGFPLKHRANAPKTYVAPVTRKNVVQRASSTTAPFKPEPALDTATYNEILDIMENMTLVMERSPTAFVRMGEEDIRQHFLVQLNGRYEGGATGETFNFDGKTDILIRVDGKTIFIAECKFWTGPKVYLETIDQLLGATEDHPNKKRGPEKLGETRFRFTFSNPNDSSRELLLTVMVFDIPQPPT